jgi:hypothetical protein
MTKDRHRPDKPANSGAMYAGTGEWSCRYFDGEWCEYLMVHKKHLTSCKGIYHSCQKQLVRHERHRDK